MTEPGLNPLNQVEEHLFPRSVWPAMLILLFLLISLATISLLFIGPRQSGLLELYTLFQTDPDLARLILMDIRLPRTLLGLLTGATLGLSGAALQSLLRNPLAEPGVIGVSGGAAFGAVMVFYFGLAGGSVLAISTGGMAGALSALAFLYLLAGKNPSVTTLILAGVAINGFAAAMTSLALNFSPNPYAAMEIVFWLMGSLVDRSLTHIVFVLPFILIGWVLLFSTGKALDALTLGEDTAASLGFDLNWLKLRIILGCGLAVGAAVAVTGAIGFVGLVVPHLLRPFVGHQPSRLLLPSAIGGAVLLSVADITVRLISPEIELKIGIITALIGAPFFLYLIMSLRKEMT